MSWVSAHAGLEQCGQPFRVKRIWRELHSAQPHGRGQRLTAGVRSMAM